ncbi:hypothetical protein VOLCADRAFT_104913 [Volvox carteri f. nagariensis]|uniref:Uncharacterized protein n=1 Tax=Volvox carteri f. nagariensis TaxID=3068 RepID=D8TWZ7_VOLCA|nr:uncharacterized protein VOLCADRAFT_104913 [Volvox carteri f. nagariensis]EFJ47822.1 hypothetical protein VOLCADRAFT_104913 [Volvox carteri f. nagariensis]|eukprot:XP_002950928.1 hypothetical protein VOLCADRAFT_104913 [Volvox carteri f. nagariensis]
MDDVGRDKINLRADQELSRCAVDPLDLVGCWCDRLMLPPCPPPYQQTKKQTAVCYPLTSDRPASSSTRPCTTKHIQLAKTEAAASFAAQQPGFRNRQKDEKQEIKPLSKAGLRQP